MAIIKNNDAHQITSEAVVLDLSDLHQQADRILEQARAKAAEIVEHAEQRAKVIIDDAAQTGHDEGYARGMKEGRTAGTEAAREEVFREFQPHLQKVADGWSAQLEHWERTRAELLTRAGNDVLTFAFALGERVIHRAIANEPSLVAVQVKEALSVVSQPTHLVIEVHPDDRPLVERVLPSLMEHVSESAEATLRDDPSMSRGGCRIATDGGAIDARIEQQLDRLAEVLLPDGRKAFDQNLSGELLVSDAKP